MLRVYAVSLQCTYIEVFDNPERLVSSQANPPPPRVHYLLPEKIKTLLVQSREAFVEGEAATPPSKREEADDLAIVRGARQAALICVASRAAAPEAIALVRYHTHQSIHVLRILLYLDNHLGCQFPQVRHTLELFQF